MWWRRSRWRAVAKVGELKPGDIVAVTVDGSDVALGLAGDRYFAVQRNCPHRGSDLTAGFIAGNQVVCRQHGWRFSTETGRHLGVIDACLTVYDVRVVGDQIEIDAVARK